MINRNEPWVRLTHIPTGLTAISRCGYSRRASHHQIAVELTRNARALLRAKLAKLREDPSWSEARCPGGQRVRTYDLHPPLGIGPHVRNHPDGAWHPFSGRYDAPVTPDMLDRLMVERRRASQS